MTDNLHAREYWGTDGNVLARLIVVLVAVCGSLAVDPTSMSARVGISWLSLAWIALATYCLAWRLRKPHRLAWPSVIDVLLIGLVVWISLSTIIAVVEFDDPREPRLAEPRHALTAMWAWIGCAAAYACVRLVIRSPRQQSMIVFALLGIGSGHALSALVHGVDGKQPTGGAMGQFDNCLPAPGEAALTGPPDVAEVALQVDFELAARRGGQHLSELPVLLVWSAPLALMLLFFAVAHDSSIGLLRRGAAVALLIALIAASARQLPTTAEPGAALAANRLVAENSWLGTGLGQFADYHTRNLPAAPVFQARTSNNGYVDLAAASGVPAVVILVLLIAVAIGGAMLRGRTAGPVIDEKEAPPFARHSERWLDVLAALSGMAIGSILEWSTTGTVELPWLWLLVGWITAAVLIPSNWCIPAPQRTLTVTLFVCALVLLFVGSLEYPAAVVFLLVLVGLHQSRPDSVVAIADGSESGQTVDTSQRSVALVGTVALLLLAAAAFWTQVIPVHRSAMHLNRATRASESQQITAAIGHLTTASEADSLSSYVTWRLALAEFAAHVERLEGSDGDRCLELLSRAEKLAPRVSFLQLGTSQLRSHLATNTDALLRAAIAAATQGVFVDPQRSEAMVVVAAIKYRLTGLDAALPYVEQAIQLDDEQRQAGHAGQTLSAELRSRLEVLVPGASDE